MAGVSDAGVRGLVTAGPLIATRVAGDATPPEPDPAFAPPAFSADQPAVADELVGAVDAGAAVMSGAADAIVFGRCGPPILPARMRMRIVTDAAWFPCYP